MGKKLLLLLMGKKSLIIIVSVIMVTAVAIPVLSAPGRITEKKQLDYTVTFDSDGGNTVASQQIKKDGLVSKPADPVKEGFIFDGWYYISPDYSTLFDFDNMRINWDITLTATWTPDTIYFTVTFDSDGGSAIASQQVEKGGLVSKPADPVKGGFIFNGWYYISTDYSTLFNFGDIRVNWDITLTATWTPDITYFTVTFDSDGGSAIASQQVEKGGLVSKPADSVKDGFIFDGWYYYSPDYSTLFNFDDMRVNWDITLKAKWTPVSDNLDTTPDPKPDAKPDPKPDPKPDSKPDSKPNTKPSPTPTPTSKPNPTPTPKSNPTPDPKPDHKQEHKNDPKPDPKQEHKNDPKPTPTPTPTPKPNPTPAPKPDPKHEHKKDSEPTTTPDPQPTLSSVNPTAVVEKLTGNKNNLTITIHGTYSDGSTKVIASKTFSIDNNADGTYSVGGYNVYVATQGNTKITACYVVG